MQSLISIIIPIYNEEQTLLQILKAVNSTSINNSDLEIIVVNDGSSDNSLKILQENNNLYNKIVTYEKNCGKGFAVKKGLSVCSGEYIVFQDADLEYDPKDLEDFVALIKKFKNIDLIIGSRFNYKNYTRSHNFFNRIGNFFITNFFNLLYSTTFTDIYSCYACYKKDLINHNSLRSSGFEQHAEILCKIVKNGKRFYEVPINYNGRGYDEGKKIKFYHIFSVIFMILVERFR